MIAFFSVLRLRVPLFAGFIAVMSSSISQPAAAQATVLNEWTWMDGSSQGRQPAGVYGQLGVAASGNTPGGRESAISWTDTNGNLWLYGSALYGFDAVGTSGYLDDVWEYNISTQEWTWVAGSSTVPTGGLSGSGGGTISGPSSQCIICAPPAVFGTYQTPSVVNTPGSLQYPTRWIDKEGNLWLFGGFEYYMVGTETYTQTLNALWEFNVSSHEWAWMGGSNSLDGNTAGVYGTLGQPAAGNTPGGRSGAVSWTDSSGNLWLFGGNGFDSAGNTGYLNDLWMFNPSINQWTWMGGSSTFSAGCVNGSSVCSAPSVYGTYQTPAAGNIPQGRSQAFIWTDSKGNVWVFGGLTEVSYDINGTSGLEGTYINDLWEFNSTTLGWAWMSGNSTPTGNAPQYGNSPGVYGTLGTPSATSNPGGRIPSVSALGGSPQYTWTDGSGNLWLFGGTGFDSTTTTGTLNDLWKFDPSINEWTWMGGSSKFRSCTTGSTTCSQPAVYGTLGTPAAGNIPGARAGAMQWIDGSGNYWLFGGWGTDSVGTWGVLNDLWKFTPSTNLWTWMGGSSTVPNDGSNSEGQFGVYGSLGMQAATNMPGGRQAAASWTDSTGMFWIFGGSGCGSNYCGGWLNDLWEYEPSTPVITTSYILSAASGSVTMAADGSTGNGTTTINTYVTGGFDSAIALAASGQPSGVTVSFSPTSITGAGSSTMTITIGSSIAIGTYPITVTGTSGSILKITAVMLNAVSTTPAATPTFNPPGGTYTSAQPVTISDTTPGAKIYYTTNNTTPTTSSNIYSGPITVLSPVTIEAIAVASGYPNSNVAKAFYNVNIPVAATPSLSLASGIYAAGQTVTISDTTPGVTIYYTTDGSMPTTSSAVYSGSITVSTPEVLKAIAVASGYTNSAVAAATYLFSIAPVAQTFSNPVLIPTSQDPISVFVVDLNGDGLPDLLYETAGVNSTPGTMQTLLAQPSGGYAQGLATTLPLMVGDCRPVDVNNDGKQDLVCISYIDACDSQIATFLGNGDGTFQPPIYSGLMQSICPGTTNFYPWLYTPADVNSDSIPDLIVGNGLNMEFFVLLGDGKGHFNVSFTAYPATVQGGYGGEMFVADLNGDGKPDLFTSVGPWVWLGNGDGTFTEKGNYGNYDSCTLYDIEADGHPDAVCANLFTTSGMAYDLDILHGNTDGSFNTTPVSSTPLQGGPAALTSPTAILDINGDGIPDILGASSDGLSVILGQPNLKFKAPVHYAVGSFGAVGSTTSQIVDLNGDGYKDIICTGTGGLYISYGTKNGSYKAPPSYPVANLLGQVTVADFNGDGIPDIAATGDNGIEVSLGNGDGSFKPFVTQPNGVTTFSQSNGYYMQIAHGDYRGNGKQDLLAVGGSYNSGFNPYILFGNGDGTFSGPQVVNGLLGSWSGIYPGSIADFNNDGRDDIFYINFTQDYIDGSGFHFYVALSNGDGTFNTVTTLLPIGELIGTPAPPFPAFADFNKDGKLDAVLVDGANAYVFQGKGDGSFNTNALVLPIPPYQGQSLYYKPLAVTTGDFDGDGNPDFAVLAEVGGYVPPPAPETGAVTAVYVFYGNGDGTFSPPVIAGGFNELYDTIYSADINKNGRSDLILLTIGSGNTSILPGTGIAVVPSISGRLFGLLTPYVSGSTAGGAFIADVNRDGYPDVLVSNTGFGPSEYTYNYNNSVTVLLNLGSQTNPNLVATTTTIVTSSSSVTAGTAITFTATVSSSTPGAGTPTGTVTFADQTGIRTTVSLVPGSNSTATAMLTTSAIGIGSDVMGATYSGDYVFASSTARVSQSVTGNPVTITFTATPNPGIENQTVTLAVTVANPAGSIATVPTGYINFSDGSSIFAGPTSVTNGVATYYTSFAAPGVHTLTASYSGDAIHATGSATITEAVLIQPTLSYPSVPIPIMATQSVQIQETVSGVSGYPTPTGTITLTCCGNTAGSPIVYTSAPVTLSNGSGTINIPAGALPLTKASNLDWLTITYSPDAASSSVYTSNSYTFYTFVEIIPTIAITPSAPSITRAQPLNLTVAVSGGSGNPTPTGTVTVQGGGYYPGSGQPLSNGSVTITIPAESLSLGNDQLTVIYMPDSTSEETYTNNNGSVTVTVTPQAPTVSVKPGSYSMTTAQPLSVTVTVAGVAGSPVPSGWITLNCGTYASSSVAMSGGSATISIPANSLAAGNDTLTATYSPDTAGAANFSSASGTSAAVVVTQGISTPTVTVSPSSSNITTAQALSVSVYVSGGSSNPTPTGSVTLSGGGYTSTGTALSSGSATINIPAGSLAAGSDTLTASYTPDSNSASVYYSATGTSSAVTVSLVNPVPDINGISPAFTSAGGATFTLTVTGTGFMANSTVYWGSSSLSTTYGSATQLTAQVPAADVATAGTTALGNHFKTGHTLSLQNRPTE
ncbi:MAG: FG-GAP-like repeat-containing protein [Terracidiphilus sp.]|jgi:N-acetylneuraminic acid mutarotase